MHNLRLPLLASTLAASVILSVAAQAADLPRRTIVAPAPFVAVPVFTWTGFYVGANAGYGFANDNNDVSTSLLGNNLVVPAFPTGALTPLTFTDGTTGLLGTNTDSNDAFVGGGQIGYNYQFTPGSGFVIGVEADAQSAGFRRNDDCSNSIFACTGTFSNVFTAAAIPDGGLSGLGIVAPPVAGATGNVALFNNGLNGFGEFDSRRIDWFATVRGRVGYAIDRLLIYGTGGVAFTDRNNDTTTSAFFNTTVPAVFFTTPAAAVAGAAVAASATPFGFSNSSNNGGYAVGGGVEYAFTNNLTAKLEGLYVNFNNGSRNDIATNAVVGVTNTGAAVTATNIGLDNRRGDDFGVIRAGLNYKFSAF